MNKHRTKSRMNTLSYSVTFNSMTIKIRKNIRFAWTTIVIKPTRVKRATSQSLRSPSI
ncbi:hypothetical protein GJ496_010942, partial [Pomphorhynchus laevis]